MSVTWIASASLVLCLSACGGPAAHHLANYQTGGGVPTGMLDFDWRLSGDRSVAPLQVFSDPTHIWLQWQPHQTLPAIFGRTDSGEQIVEYQRHGPYTKLDGRWGVLLFRGAHQQARARRLSSQKGEGAHTTPTLTKHALPPSRVQTVTAPVDVTASSVPQAFYAITAADKNLRQALSRWSNLSGWRFQAEHWSVDVDIPLTATANFTDDFVGSVKHW